MADPPEMSGTHRGNVARRRGQWLFTAVTGVMGAVLDSGRASCCKRWFRDIRNRGRHIGRYVRATDNRMIIFPSPLSIVTGDRGFVSKRVVAAPVVSGAITFLHIVLLVPCPT
jgi:hypothetical protein